MRGKELNKKDALGVEKAELSQEELEQISGGYFRITNIRGECERNYRRNDPRSRAALGG